MNKEMTKNKNIFSELNEIICLNKNEDEILCEIRSFIVDLEISELCDKVSEEELAFLYILKKLTNDIWESLGTDAPFDITDIKIQFSDIAKDIVEFVKLSCKKNAKTNSEDYKFFINAVNKFYSLIYHLDNGQLNNKKLQKG